ncbi:uncharacterized protein F4807DRAFT_421103 [Annulohypoxylon truncatum]|uniref:uncharacterized protein n=1 Tax=Annulohypoxylon truncatum TaxID=327061 RepID=UPI0020089C24|nr:uncharacterized protein F4807DRAFT_421103 [Annulohypoxylon truncatum]KAI1210978.1 hypothetical protein F4807DRAFT_421103 [Annulohypoxylon truncatum]
MATDWNKLKVVDLKAQLKSLGLPQNGLKADLVARLVAAESEKNASPSPDEATEGTEDVNDEPQPQQESPKAPEAIEPSPPNESPKQSEVGSEAVHVEPETPVAAPAAEAQAIVAPSSSGATPLRASEALQDSQKRKRRSLSPAPSTHEVARKRARQEDGDSQEDQAADPIPEEVDEVAPRKEETSAPSDVEMQGAKDDAPTEPEPGHDIGIAQPSPTENVPLVTQNGHTEEDVTMDDTEPTFEGRHEDPSSREETYNAPLVEIERDVAPSIHPATCALYIKDFMRPLREQAVKDHLLDLATPVGAPIEDGTIVDFYLDNIRTHAFVVFNSISSASRVRTALHNRIWPDETNRKALWVDFMPSERFAEWVDMEQTSSGRRGSTNRYEVVYDNDEDGNVIVKLEEFDSTGPAPKQTLIAPEPAPERKQSIPTGPSRSFAGIEGAPTGPRGFPGGRGSAIHPNRMARIDQAGQTTRAFPTITYQPVSDELVRRRLDTISAAKSKSLDRDFGKEYKRYYFENGDTLVDRGPEIFLGIRPPHRERERQRDQRRDPRDPRDPPRARRGGGGGNGRRRGGMPIFHGVPRGGDRFRPGESSGPGPNGRSRYADDRPGRRYDDRGSRRDRDRY